MCAHILRASIDLVHDLLSIIKNISAKAQTRLKEEKLLPVMRPKSGDFLPELQRERESQYPKHSQYKEATWDTEMCGTHIDMRSYIYS